MLCFGKGLSIWDEFVHRKPSPDHDGTTGDVACDSYHKYREDVALLKYLGAGVYRFSLSWSRILPSGRVDYINPAGLKYYNDLIDILIENGNLEITQAPGFRNLEEAKWCVHNSLRSHAKAYRLYDQVFRPHQHGKVGMAVFSQWYEPRDPANQMHVKIAEFTVQITWGVLASPIFFGKYPAEFDEFVGLVSKTLGSVSTPLKFTLAEAAELRGSWDFCAMTHYTTSLVEPTAKNNASAGISAPLGIILGHDPAWPSGAAGTVGWGFYVVPWGFRKMLNWIKRRYGNPEIYVLENGYQGKPAEGLEDHRQVEYHRSYINEMLKAVRIDGVNVQVYAAWTLMDDFEWVCMFEQFSGIRDLLKALVTPS
ncbi:lactase-phlorizin hydrolase [Folsomia candida]|uniref:lactase-phlorizin hydrolase n=1 Tax=Folsomia candida TaxID=158441 RepID=UPI000B8FD5F8|nr:lactase-phlorizin hydrolase [Folsomia candida]